MVAALKILFIIGILFNIISWSSLPNYLVKIKKTESKQPPQTICKSIIKKKKLVLQSVAKSNFYDFLPYEACNNNNDYLNNFLDQSQFTKKYMNQNILSPACTFAGLSHKLKGAYQKSCHKKPQFTKYKPCLTKKYHSFVHNQIATAAQCFHMDPKTLFSLYSTESFLQVNVKPSPHQSAEGISQLMPQFAVKHINKTITNHEYEKENLYKRNLRYYLSRSNSLLCHNYLNNLKQAQPKKESKNQCSQKTLDDKVSQDIYYSIAYRLESIKKNVKTLIKYNSLPIADYSRFFNKLNDNKSGNISSCSANDHKCKIKSKVKTEEFISNAKNTLKSSIHYLSKIKPKIGAGNIIGIIVNSFPQFELHASSNQFAESKLSPLLNNLFVKNYCKIQTIPQLKWYPSDKYKQKNNSAKELNTNLDELIAEIRQCKRQLEYAYMDIFHSFPQDTKKIFNETSFYQHNGGTKMNYLFKKYIKKIGVKKASRLSFKEFTGKKRGSFRHFIINQEGHSQVSNFLYNTPGYKNGRRVAGSLSSTTYNMKILKNNLKTIKSRSSEKLNENQEEYIFKLSNRSGFNQLCSYY